MKLIILDRDGVINYDSMEYIKSPDEWHAIPGSLAAIARLNRAGYRVAVATNQSGIARGYYDEAMLARIHQKMHDELAAVGGHVDYVVHCPHHPDEHCHCRKPQPGMLEQIAEYFQVPLEGVPFVGDRHSDGIAAQTVSARPIYLYHQDASKQKQSLAAENDCFAYLSDFVEQWLSSAA